VPDAVLSLQFPFILPVLLNRDHMVRRFKQILMILEKKEISITWPRQTQTQTDTDNASGSVARKESEDIRDERAEFFYWTGKKS